MCGNPARVSRGVLVAASHLVMNIPNQDGVAATPVIVPHSGTPSTSSNIVLESPGTIPDLSVGGFDIASLALPQGFNALAAVQMEITAIPLKRPSKQAFFATLSDRTSWFTVPVLQDDSEGKSYILTPQVREQIPDDWSPKVLVPCVTRQGTLYLWPIKLPDADGRSDTWNESALAIVCNCGNRWIRVKSNRESGTYEAVTPVADFAPPVWPEDIPGLFRKASANLVIDRIDHPVIKRLRGVE